MLFLEPLQLHLLGTTPGKAVFGLRIETPDGRRLSYREGLERIWGVIGAGMGYNIPFYSLYRLWKSYKRCSENEVQPWDESISYSIKNTKWYRGVLFAGASAAVFALLLVIMSAQMLPPNRGNLTVAEFADNYNYYAKYLDIDIGNRYLDQTGQWAERPSDGTITIELNYTEYPEYIFTIENGYVTGVSFAVELENSQEFLGSYDAQMILSSLAFVGAQNETGLFSKIPSRILDQIQNNTFKSYNFTEAGLTISCDTEYLGYRDTQFGFLAPEENAAETYFILNYSINKPEY